MTRTPLGGNEGEEGSAVRHTVEYPEGEPWLGTRLGRDLADVVLLCDGTRSARAIARALVEQDGLDDAAAESFVAEALEALLAYGIIELV